MTISPTKLQLALALHVIRVKPPELSIQQYIYDLRNHIDSGQRPQFSRTYEESQNNYINAAFHFESLLKESEQEVQSLHNQLAASEREVEQLRARLIAREHENPSKGQDENKKARPKAIARAEPQHATVEQRLLEQEEDNLRKEIEFTTKHSRIGDTVLRLVYRLCKELQIEHTDHARLAYLLSQILTEARRLVRAIQRAVLENPDGAFFRDSSEHIILRAFKVSVVPMIFQSIFKLENGSYVSSGALGNLVHDTLALCQVLVGYLSLLSELAAEVFDVMNHRLGEEWQPPGSRPAFPWINSKTLESVSWVLKSIVHQCQTPDREATSDDYANFRRPRSNPTLAAILEGLLHLLLVRSGTLIRTLTTQAPEPSPMEQMKGEAPGMVRAARLEAKALTPILRLLLPGFVHADFLFEDALSMTLSSSAAKDHQDQISRSYFPAKHSTTTSSSPSKSAPGVPLGQKVSLVAQPLNKIQNTLLQGIFASEDIANISNNVLRSPLALSTMLDGRGEDDTDDEEDLDAGMPSTADDTDGEEEFVKEMWCRVGWDVLARGFELND